jgi:N-acetylglucosamine-6-sulfatase
MAGSDMLPLAKDRAAAWRDELLYEYYWERNFPQTPTVHAVREDQYKYVHLHGIWDLDELYDLAADPHENNNLLANPGHENLAARLSAKLIALFEKTNGMQILLSADAGFQARLRSPDGGRQATFPAAFYRPPEKK